MARRGDPFYEHVAAFVRNYKGRDFAVALAKASDVPKSTAFYWIREARDRGLLEPAVNQSKSEYVCTRCGFTRAEHRKVPKTIVDPRDRCIFLLRRALEGKR